MIRMRYDCFLFYFFGRCYEILFYWYIDVYKDSVLRCKPLLAKLKSHQQNEQEKWLLGNYLKGRQLFIAPRAKPPQVWNWLSIYEKSQNGVGKEMTELVIMSYREEMRDYTLCFAVGLVIPCCYSCQLLPFPSLSVPLHCFLSPQILNFLSDSEIFNKIFSLQLACLIRFFSPQPQSISCQLEKGLGSCWYLCAWRKEEAPDLS